MLHETVNNRFRLHQRIILMIMLVALQFHSFGSDFFLDDFTVTHSEQIEQSGLVPLDFDDHATLRTVRQEPIQIQAFVTDLIFDSYSDIDLHGLFHQLELRQCAYLPLFYHLQRAENFVWFCSFLI